MTGTNTIHGSFVEFTLVSPDYKGRKLFKALSDNSAPSASEIAKMPLGTIWYKATPTAGYLAFIKTAPTVVKECMAIAV